jgi:hypothetical protein
MCAFGRGSPTSSARTTKTHFGGARLGRADFRYRPNPAGHVPPNRPVSQIQILRIGISEAAIVDITLRPTAADSCFGRAAISTAAALSNQPDGLFTLHCSAEPVIHLAPWFALYVRFGARRRALESNQLQSLTDYSRRHASRISSSLPLGSPVYSNHPNPAQSAMAQLELKGVGDK